MTNNKTVYLLVGPRGAGKSTYAQKLIKAKPDLVLLSRDAILLQLYGKENVDPYTEATLVVMSKLRKCLREQLSKNTDMTIILDCWTQDSQERKYWIRTLREYGATKVIALLFITPLTLVEKWFWKKPGIMKVKDGKHHEGEEDIAFYDENAPRRCFELFCEWVQYIDDDGFDQVIRVNPLEPPISFS